MKGAIMKKLLVLAFSILTFTTANAEVMMKEEYSEKSVDALISDIDKELEGKEKGYTIVLYLNSPGGSVFAGNRLIHHIMKKQTAGFKFNGVVTEMCASMCFITLQYLDKRLSYPFGMLLDHPASGGKRVDNLSEISELHADKILSRIKTDKTMYKRLVKSELLMNSKTALRFGVIDKVIKPGEENIITDWENVPLKK